MTNLLRRFTCFGTGHAVMQGMHRYSYQVRRSVLCAALLLAGCSLVGGPSIEPEPPREAEISGRVKEAFVGSDRVDAAAILVAVREDVIELTGFVGSKAEKREAQALAAEAYPKMTIDNRLEVK